MENDYLWDKTGEDKEIERLENVLQQFRYQPVSPPNLPVKVLQIEEKRLFNFFPGYFRFALAGVACLLVTIFTWAIWFGGSKNKMVLVNNAPEQFHFEIRPPIKNPADSIVSLNPANPPKFIPGQKPTKMVFRNNLKKNQRIKTVQLTKEEKEAYDQLMLALAITGSKLREVKDKVNGVEPTASIKTFK